MKFINNFNNISKSLRNNVGIYNNNKIKKNNIYNNNNNCINNYNNNSNLRKTNLYDDCTISQRLDNRFKRSFISTQINSINFDLINKQPTNINEVNNYLLELASHSPFASENIRISFLSAEREIKNIKGLKLYGFNSDRSWLVIVAGKEPNQWSTISLCLYLGALFSYQPLDNLDILLFPIENPTIYTNTYAQPSALSSSSHFSIPLETTLGYEIQSSGSSSNQNQSSTKKDNSFEYITNSNRVSSVVFSDWLKRSKKTFKTLSMDLDQQLKPTISMVNEKPRHNPLVSDFDNLFNNNNSGIGPKLNPSKRNNYILELKDINLNLPDSKVLSVAENIRDELRYLSMNL